MNDQQNDTQILRDILDDIVHQVPEHSDSVEYYWQLLERYPSWRFFLTWLFVSKVEGLHATEVVLERTPPSLEYLRQRMDTSKSNSDAIKVPREIISRGIPGILPTPFPATIVPEFRHEASENDIRGVVISLQKLRGDTPDPILWLFSEGQEFLDKVYGHACFLGDMLGLLSPEKDLIFIYFYLKEVWVRLHVKHLPELMRRRKTLAAPKEGRSAMRVEGMLRSSATSPE